MNMSTLNFVTAALPLAIAVGSPQAGGADSLFGGVDANGVVMTGKGFGVQVDSDAESYTINFDQGSFSAAPVFLASPYEDNDNGAYTVVAKDLTGDKVTLSIRSHNGEKKVRGFYFAAINKDGFIGSAGSGGYAQGCVDEDGKKTVKLIHATVEKTGQGHFQITYDSELFTNEPAVIVTAVRDGDTNARAMTVTTASREGAEVNALDDSGNNKNTGFCFLAVSHTADLGNGSRNVFGIVEPDGDPVWSDNYRSRAVGATKDGIYDVTYRLPGVGSSYPPDYLPVVLTTPMPGGDEKARYTNISASTDSGFELYIRNAHGDKSNAQFSFMTIDPALANP